MIAWLWRWIVGDFHPPAKHQHEWETFAEEAVTMVRPDGYELKKGTNYHLRCKGCGEVKFKWSGA